EREAPALHQGSIQREQDRNAPDLEVATGDAVAVGEVSELDLEVQLFVVLVPEGDHPAGLHQPVRSALLGQVRGVARNERAGAAFPSDGEWAYVGDPVEMAPDVARLEVATRWPGIDPEALEVEFHVDFERALATSRNR